MQKNYLVASVAILLDFLDFLAFFVFAFFSFFAFFSAFGAGVASVSCANTGIANENTSTKLNNRVINFFIRVFPPEWITFAMLLARQRPKEQRKKIHLSKALM